MKNIAVDQEGIAALCARWGISELSFFGSVLGEDFRPDSDVDVLATFLPGAVEDVDEWLALTEELTAVVGRPVHLVDRSTLRNPYRRRSILTNREVIYAA